MNTPGKRNLITDVAGLRVGNAQDLAINTGVTVLTADAPFTCGVSVMGGAPGSRETELLAPDKTVAQVDALVLSGGSALGLDACSGVANALRAQGRGFAVGGQNVPIVPGAIIFDLNNGGDKAWAENPYPLLGAQALAAVSDKFDLGSSGAGTGGTTATLKGGLGSASVTLPSGHTVGALVVVNALGSATVGDGPHFWAAPFEMDDEFGARGVAAEYPDTHVPRTKLAAHANTTIGIVATDAALDKAQCTRLATAAQDGYARALVPAHTPMDGDLIFAVSTGARALQSPLADTLTLGHAAATCMARAIARAVYHASATPNDTQPSWGDRFG
ncbi:P1 family peptidase [Lutimaribacter sp. EGI FJ00015]|uniref:P1 family peptidase n=1 Tax=Lutimaribacter degradans TaxID=2945989 RepID=A0ACC5ZYR5_9RHOB|nr:P1 family peptidase [Lutimaribacter sp. EGI FJ00013]MCM2563058.1 P1 family peptidase [Lutimaribacter sp. EGI FJ00013]MCO0614237.1 P1 family peptidase [Lutimaribacter sp. EGI FJ00015]MCO0637047.1 P1 family peptidase [Lutimaribacter sp. EGI FJ00014]